MYDSEHWSSISGVSQNSPGYGFYTCSINSWRVYAYLRFYDTNTRPTIPYLHRDAISQTSFMVHCALSLHTFSSLHCLAHLNVSRCSLDTYYRSLFPPKAVVAIMVSLTWLTIGATAASYVPKSLVSPCVRFTVVIDRNVLNRALSQHRSSILFSSGIDSTDCPPNVVIFLPLTHSFSAQHHRRIPFPRRQTYLLRHKRTFFTNATAARSSPIIVGNTLGRVFTLR